MLLKITLGIAMLLPCYKILAQPAPVNSKTFIQVDQFGYRTTVKKVAVIGDPIVGFNSGDQFIPSTGANQYQVRKTADNTVAFTGTAVQWNGGNTDVTSGDRAWWFDFSALTAPGEYYIYDAGKNAKSFKFKIGDNVYNDVLKTAMRMFYYNRCGAVKTTANAGANYADGASFLGPLQDKNARSVFDKNNAATEKDLSGGWWDAGDFNKYVTFARKPVNVLLTSYTKNPAIWADNYNIPESGNGIPDILDEVKWELDWLKKMQLADGSSLIKMGFAWNDFSGTEYPSADTRRRYYYPGGCSGATISSACVFAHAANVFKNVSAFATYATDLQTRSINAWNNFKNKTQLDIKCDIVGDQSARDNGTAIQAGDADADIGTEIEQRDIQFMAAVYLFALTGQQEYKTFVDTKYDQTVLFRNSQENINADYMDALIKYAFLPNATATVASAIKLKLTERGQNQDYLRFTAVSDSDAYRSFMPYYFYNFGSNSTRSEIGALSSNLGFYNLGTANKQEFLTKAEEVVHYFHGVNPFGKVYLSNMYQLGAGNSVNQFYHSWFSDGSPWDSVGSSKGGPPPGYVVGGPNSEYRLYSGSPCLANEGIPCNQPIQKAYKDFNNPENGNNISYEITEPAIYYQAAYIQLLSAAVTTTTQPPATGNGTGLSGNYFNNKTLTGTAVYSKTEAVNFDWGNGSPNASVTNDNFSARWEGDVEAPANGVYAFSTISDDGVRLFVNGIKIIDNFTDHASTTDNGNQTFTFVAGTKYKIKMEYYESAGGAVAKLLWTIPGQPQTAIPKDRLYPITNSTTIIVAAQSISSVPATMRIEIMDSQNTVGGTVQQSKAFTNMSSAMTVYTAVFNGNIPANRVRVRLIDNTNVDLKVDYLKIGTTTYQSEGPATYSIGHWNQANGCNNSGYLLVDELYCNGYFQYNSGTAAAAKVIAANTMQNPESIYTKEIQVFPNPAHDNTRLGFYSKKIQAVDIIITDVNGRVVKRSQHKAFEGFNTILLQLPKQTGLYIIQVLKDGKTEIKKVGVK